MSNNMTRARTLLASAAILPLLMTTAYTDAFGQSAERFQQGLEGNGPQRVTIKSRDASAEVTDETVLIDSLEGVVIVHDPQSVNVSGAASSGVVADDELVPAGVSAAANKYVGSPVSLASLDRMTRDMVLAYRKAGRPVVNIVVPPQDITNGVIQIVAVVGRLGNVTVEGNAANPDYYTEGFQIASGEVIEEGPVLDQLRWKSRRFHRRVNAIYAPGESFSLTDLALDVEETKPWSIFVGADNTGEDSAGGVGEYRLFSGFLIGDLWGLDHEMSYQFSTSEEGVDNLNAHVLSYTLPVLSRTDLQLFGSYIKSGTDGGVAADGRSYQLGATFISQIPTFMGISADARYGFAYKNSDNNLEFNGGTVFGTAFEIGNFNAQITGNYSLASWHSSTFTHGVTIAPGDMFDNNTDVAIDATRAGASADYVYFRSASEHTFYLPRDWYATLGLQSQWSSERLPTSEMIYLGGLNTIRGFDENAVRGDKGGLARFEIYTPATSILTEETRDAIGAQDALRGYAFFDVGYVEVNEPFDMATDLETTIGGIGVGLTYQIGSQLSAEMAYGWNVIDDDNVGSDGQFHFRVLSRW